MAQGALPGGNRIEVVSKNVSVGRINFREPWCLKWNGYVIKGVENEPLYIGSGRIMLHPVVQFRELWFR